MLPQDQSDSKLKIALLIAITILAAVVAICYMDSQTNSQNGDTNGGNNINGDTNNPDANPDAPILEARPDAIQWGTLTVNRTNRQTIWLRNWGHSSARHLNMTVHSIVGLTDPIIRWNFEDNTIGAGSGYAVIFSLTVTETPEPDWSFHILIKASNCQLWILNSS